MLQASNLSRYFSCTWCIGKNTKVFAIGRGSEGAGKRRRFNSRSGKQRLRVAGDTRVMGTHDNAQGLTLRRPRRGEVKDVG